MTLSPDCFPIVLRRSTLRGSLCLPSPSAMKELGRVHSQQSHEPSQGLWSRRSSQSRPKPRRSNRPWQDSSESTLQRICRVCIASSFSAMVQSLGRMIVNDSDTMPSHSSTRPRAALSPCSSPSCDLWERVKSTLADLPGVSSHGKFASYSRPSQLGAVYSRLNAFRLLQIVTIRSETEGPTFASLECLMRLRHDRSAFWSKTSGAGRVAQMIRVD